MLATYPTLLALVLLLFCISSLYLYGFTALGKHLRIHVVLIISGFDLTGSVIQHATI
jgi:hypothetical protein